MVIEIGFVNFILSNMGWMVKEPLIKITNFGRFSNFYRLVWILDLSRHEFLITMKTRNF